MNKKYIFLSFVFIIFSYVALFFLSLMIGDSLMGVSQIAHALFGNEDEITTSIIFDVRLPRVLMAILIGMLLASSGAITQTIFSNPIADPYIIGIASAATFGAVIAYVLKMPDYTFGLFGFVCCCLFSFFIFAISKRSNITTLLIVGIATSAFLGAFTSFFIYVIGEESFKITAWAMGSLSLASWNKIFILCVPLAFCLFFFYLCRNQLNIILSGDDEARNLGVNSAKLKIVLLMVSSLAVSFGVAFSGLIGFVGLIVPHIIRLMIKNYDNALVLPLCTLLGGVFLLLCDSIARTILSPVEIPIGVVTAIFGAPVFLYLALRARSFL